MEKIMVLIDPNPPKGWVSILQLDWQNVVDPCMRAKAMLTADLSTIMDLYSLGLYRKVASVNADNLEDAFTMSQNSEDFPGIPWTLYPVVTAEASYIGGARSTSVGDILVKDGEAYVLRPIGYEILPVVPTNNHLA